MYNFINGFFENHKSNFNNEFIDFNIKNNNEIY